MYKFPILTLLLISCCATMISAAPKPVVRVTTRQHVHPVLIRNDQNSLLRIIVHSSEDGPQVSSFVISLKGTDDLNDVKSLQLFNPQRKPFAKSAKPSDKIILKDKYTLKKGRNEFWLSCRLNPRANLSHRIDAACTTAKVLGDMTVTDETPGIPKRIGIALRKHNDDNVHTHRIAALTTTPQGTLLCVYDLRRRKSRDLQEDIDIGLSRSTDGGQTWASPQVIMDMGQYGGLPQEQNGCSDPGILVDPQTGEIFCAAVWMSGRPGTHQWSKGGSEPGFKIGQSAQFMMVRSQDDGKTWTKPENLTRKLKKEKWILLAPSPQQGITLRDGTLVMPIQGRDENDGHFSTIMTSVDHGKSWRVGSATALGNTECQAVQLSDDSIMLNARTEQPTKFRSVYRTTDLGKTWQPHSTHRKALIEPNCNGSLLRFDYQQGGRQKSILVFANPHSQSRRDHHTIKISFDEGKTWPKDFHLLLDEGLGRGYPSLTRVDENHLGIVYEGSQSDLVFERISLDELLKRE